MFTAIKTSIQGSGLIWFVLLSLLILTILLLRYIAVMKRYIKELASAYDFVAQGKYNHKISLNVRGDLGKAGLSFNLMTAQIKSNIKELKDKNSKLHAILKSISSGIIVVDSNQNIMLMNKTAQDIWKYPDDYEGKPLFLNYKADPMKQRISEMIYEETDEAIQLESESVWYKVKVDPVRIDGDSQIVIGSIINIEDVTERVRSEQMRRDFVANVSHELKTLLTSISGFVETLKNNEMIDREKQEKFLGIIELESNRLKRLIDDILILSTIENLEKYYDFTEFSMNELVEDCVGLLSTVARTKDVSLSAKVSVPDLKMYSGADLIKQMLINLMDNGIKYSDTGGDVNIEVSEQNDKVQIVVEDHGIGMPKEDLPRIFERFYRVDKARSKKESGTGLGLAIVKHSVIRLKGSIEVESSPGEGTKFVIRLPKRMN